MRISQRALACGLLLATAGSLAVVNAQAHSRPEGTTVYSESFPRLDLSVIQNGITAFLDEVVNIVGPDTTAKTKKEAVAEAARRRAQAVDPNPTPVLDRIREIFANFRMDPLFMELAGRFQNIRAFISNLGDSVLNFDLGNLGSVDFVRSIKSVTNNIHIPKSLDEAKFLLLGVVEELCYPEVFVPVNKDEKKLLECLGYQFRIDLQPLTCTIDAKAREVTCIPPQLIVSQLPAFCQKFFKQPATFVGHFCQLVKRFGDDKTKTFPPEPIAEPKVIKVGVNVTGLDLHAILDQAHEIAEEPMEERFGRVGEIFG